MIVAVRNIFEVWTTWSARSVNRRIFAAGVTITLYTSLVSLLIFAKDLMVAQRFGTSDSLDAFLIVWIVPLSLGNIVSRSLGYAFMPTFIRTIEEEGEASAKRLFATMLGWSLLLSLIVTAILVLGRYHLLSVLGSAFSPEKLALASGLFLMVAPTLILSSYSFLAASVLNAKDRFALAALAPGITPLTVVLMMLGFGRHLGIYALAFGTLLGFLGESAIMACGLKFRGMPVMPKWCDTTPKLKRVWTQFFPVVAGSALLTGNTLVDQSFAAMLLPGSVASLSYANKIFSFVINTGAMALGSAIVPHFSRMVAIGDRRGLIDTFRKYTTVILGVTLPLTAFLYFFSDDLIRLIFQRGAFTRSDSVVVSGIQRFYLLQIPFFAMSTMLSRLISAFHRNQILFKGTVLGFVLNIVLDFVFIRHFGVGGIALSTSVVVASCTLFLAFMAVRLMKGMSHESNPHEESRGF